ncbi:MAG: sigma-70 family RNA polymerase sigma factor [Alphaproteobacteria bacterium]
MVSDKCREVIDKLEKLYKKNGFVTEDEVFDHSFQANLSIFDTNDVTEYLLSHGVLISNDKEKFIEKKGRGKRRNNSSFFNFLKKEYKGLASFIKYYESVDQLAENEWLILLKQARQGNEWARKRLFDTSMQKIIKQLYGLSKKYDVDFEDALQDATLGIFYAIDSFDETETSSFPSYLHLAVNSRIKREFLFSNNPVITFPVQMMNNFFKVYTIVKEHTCAECNYGKNKLLCINLKEILKEKLETEEEVNELLRYFQPIEDIWEDTLISESDLSDIVLERQIVKYVHSILPALTPKEDMVIKMRFGIPNGKEYTLEEVGNRFHITRERARQIEAKALAKLKHPSHRKRIKEFFSVSSKHVGAKNKKEHIPFYYFSSDI